MLMWFTVTRDDHSINMCVAHANLLCRYLQTHEILKYSYVSSLNQAVT